MDACLPHGRPRGRASLALAVGLVGLLLVGCGAGPGPPAGARLSVLALGDTGQEPGWLSRLSGQARVARALADADRRAPAQALVLLGDNFYPDGLRDSDQDERIRENVVRPYCHFVALGPRGRERLADACDESRPGRHPIPILAVLGNHDYKLRQSPELQRKRVPMYVSNWDVPGELAEVSELGAGVSLVRVDTMRIVDGESIDPLVRALRRARGPWRIVAAHHPMADTGHGLEAGLRERMDRAFARAGVPVQLYLAGHEHNLQLLALPAPAPALHVISGAGSESRPPHEAGDERLFARDALGFARVDLVAAEGQEQLCATLHALDGPPPLARARAVARWCVDAEGRLHERGL